MSYCAVNCDRLMCCVFLELVIELVIHLCYTDASGVAVGATLGQLGKDGVEHPLAFASHKLSGSQCNWSTIEREAYGHWTNFGTLCTDQKSRWFGPT